MTPLESALQSIRQVVDSDMPMAERLATLRIIRDEAEDRIWDIKLATGIGLWRDNQ